MRSISAIVACSSIAAFVLVRQAAACFQSTPPGVVLRSTSLKGRISLNGKPLAGATLTLHKFLADYSVSAYHADSHVVSRSSSGMDGSFDFGRVPTGKYVIVMAAPSPETAEVEVIRPKPNESDTIAIEYSGDFCGSAKAISANGKRLAQPFIRASSPH
jgi:hypothetical protein